MSRKLCPIFHVGIKCHVLGKHIFFFLYVVSYLRGALSSNQSSQAKWFVYTQKFTVNIFLLQISVLPEKYHYVSYLPNVF